MKKRFLGLTLLLGLVLGLLATPVSGVVQSAHAASMADHSLLTFTIKPGGSASFSLPVQQNPVLIAVSVTFKNGGTQTPSEIMYAVVNQDPFSQQMTWVGTNSDGSQTGSNSLKTTTIASIFGGSSSTVNASLDIESLSTHRLKLVQNANTTSRAGSYSVSLWF
jgi:hypothetical protein